AASRLQEDPMLIAAVPRLAPPPLAGEPDCPAGGTYEHDHGLRPWREDWRMEWFSTRALLVDRSRLREIEPFASGRVFWRAAFHRLSRRYWPSLWESLLAERAARCGRSCLVLRDERA